MNTVHYPIVPIATVFNPPPPQAAAVLDDLCNPSLSLEEIASAHEISLDALTAWMTRDDVQERLATLGTSAALRARLLCTLQLQSAIHCITTMLKGYQSREHGASRETPEALLNLEHQRTNARRAAALLLRIARFNFERHPRASRAASESGPFRGTGPSAPRQRILSDPLPAHLTPRATTSPSAPAAEEAEFQPPSAGPTPGEVQPSDATPPIPPAPAMFNVAAANAAAPVQTSADPSTPRPAPTPQPSHPTIPTPPTSPSNFPPNSRFAALRFADLAPTSGP